MLVSLELPPLPSSSPSSLSSHFGMWISNMYCMYFGYHFRFVLLVRNRGDGVFVLRTPLKLQLTAVVPFTKHLDVAIRT